jgi:hypothetical protein
MTMEQVFQISSTDQHPTSPLELVMVDDLVCLTFRSMETEDIVWRPLFSVGFDKPLQLPDPPDPFFIPFSELELAMGAAYYYYDLQAQAQTLPYKDGGYTEMGSLNPSIADRNMFKRCAKSKICLYTLV